MLSDECSRVKVQHVPLRCGGAEVYIKYLAEGTQGSRLTFHTGYFQLGVPNLDFTS